MAKGGVHGALHGVPLAHKDMYYDTSKVVTCGSKVHHDFVATTTSTALQHLKEDGQIQLGSLQMVEFTYGPTATNVHYGAVHNPRRRSHHRRLVVRFGFAVAARLTFAALGSDTGGSIRMPARISAASPD